MTDAGRQDRSPKPTVGRIVHFQQPEGPTRFSERAAMIVQVLPVPGYVDLLVYHHNGDTELRRAVQYTRRPTWSCWNWPPRV